MTPNEAADADLDRCRRGDMRGLAALYEIYGERIQRLSRSLLGQQADAEDATQEVFLRVFRKISQFDGRSRLSTWLYRLAVNVCRNWRKRLERWPAPLPDDEDRSATSALPISVERQVEINDQVAVLLRALAPQFRAVIALREIAGLDYREIATVLEIPIGTVMSRLARARQQLLHPSPIHDAARVREVRP